MLELAGQFFCLLCWEWMLLALVGMRQEVAFGFSFDLCSFLFSSF